jgi:sulfur relay (sulfurtransferase) complex TusBCD TusD component (DsrE family)
MKLFLKLNSLLTGLVFLFLATIPCAYAVDAEEQSIAISLKQDLFTEKGYEAACISLQLGIMLAKQGATVTLFPSLDGVAIANALQLAYVDVFAEEIGEWQCTTSNGPAPLGNIVTSFVAEGGSMLVCPLCWNSRYGENAVLVEGASVGATATLAELFLGADKILDF